MGRKKGKNKTKLLSKKIPKTAVFSLSLAVNDKIYEATGKTLIDALNNIKIEPTRGVLKIYTKGILKVRKGDKEVERLLLIPIMNRLFAGFGGKLGKECAMVQLVRLCNAFLQDDR